MIHAGAKMIQSALERWWGLLLAAAIPMFLVFWRFLFGFAFIENSTFSTYIGPYFFAFRNALYGRESIFWVSNFFSGFPTFATVNGGLLFPFVHLSSYIIPPHLLYHWVIFLDITLAAFLTAVFLRNYNISGVAAWIGGLTFVFSQWPSVQEIYIMNGLPLMPLLFIVFFELSKRFRISYALLGIGAVAMGWFSVHWHFLIMILLTAGSFAFYRAICCPNPIRKLISASIIVIAGTIVGLVQIVPAYVFLGLSDRAEGFSHWGATAGGLVPSNILVALFPYLSFPFLAPTLAIIINASILIFVVYGLKLRGRSVRTFFSLLLILIILLAINHSYLFWLLHRIPPIVFLHNASRWMFVGSFVLAVLAGFGARRFMEEEASLKTLKIISRGLLTASVIIFFSAAVVMVALWFFETSILQRIYDYFDQNIYAKTIGLPLDYYHKYINKLFYQIKSSLFLFNPDLGIPLLFLLLTYVIAKFFIRGRLGRHQFVYLNAGLLFLNFVLYFGLFPRNAVHTSLLRREPATVAFLKTQEPGRIFPVFTTISLFNRALERDLALRPEDEFVFKSEMLTANANLRYDISSADADEPLTPEPMSKMLAYLGSGTFGASHGERLINQRIPLEEKMKILEERKNILNFLGVKYVISTYPLNTLDPIFKTEATSLKIPVIIYKNENARPLYYFVRTLAVREANPEVSEIDTFFSQKQNMFITCDDNCPTDKIFTGMGVIEELKRENGRLDVRLVTDTQQFFVFSENYLPGWELFIENKPAPIYLAGTVYMGAVIPAGDHNVSFRYSYPALWKYFFSRIKFDLGT